MTPRRRMGLAVTVTLAVLLGITALVRVRRGEDPNLESAGAKTEASERGTSVAPTTLAPAPKASAAPADVDANAGPPEMPGRVRIFGRVTTAAGAAMPDCTVTAWRSSGEREFEIVATTRPANDGTYELSFALAPAAGEGKAGDCLVVADAPGWVSASRTFELTGVAAYEAPLEFAAGSIVGRVVDASGRPIAHLDLRADDGGPNAAFVGIERLEPRRAANAAGEFARAETDAEGRFALRGLAGLTWTLYSATPAWFIPPTAFEPGPEERTVTAVPARSVSGTVRDARTREPVEASVGWWPTQRRVSDDGSTSSTTWQHSAQRTRDGAFRFIWPAPPADETWEYSIRAEPTSIEYGVVTAKLDGERAATELDLLVERAGIGTVVVEAVNSRGAPITGTLEMSLVAADGSETGRSVEVLAGGGRYRVTVPSDRDWTLRARPVADLGGDEGRTAFIAPTAEIEVRLRDGEVTRVKMAIEAFGRLRFRLPANATGVAVQGVGRRTGHTFEWNWDAPETARDWVLLTGAGPYVVSLPTVEPPVTREVEVREDEETIVDLR